MKKVLVITYYWPPTAGAAAQRLSAFCRYLPEHGYTPIVLTPPPHDADFPGTHATVAGWDPVALLKRDKGSAATTGNPTPSKFLEWIRLNLFVPDTKIGWRRPAIQAASALMEQERPDLLFTSAPPYTVHRVGLALKQRYHVPWVAEFRDPWVENHAYNTAPRTALSLALNRRMESATLHNADHITTALDSQRALLSGKPGVDSARVTTLHNGYDPADFSAGMPLTPSQRFVLSHFGTIYHEGFEWAFFEQLADLVRGSAPLQGAFLLRMIGSTPETVRRFLEEQFDPHHLDLQPSVPHQDIIRRLTEQQLLLLLVNRGALHRYSHPSKVYEYMASGNPVLAVGPADHEVMTILRNALPDRAAVTDTDNQWTAYFLSQFEDWRNGRMPDRVSAPTPYDRRRLTGRLAEVFTALSE